MSGTKSSPDWFARTTALLAIGLTIISLYFTHRTYNWQTKTYQEGLEERILVRFGFQHTVESGQGDVGVEVVNIGTHAIYPKSVEIEIPGECDRMAAALQTQTPDACGFMVYDRNPTKLNGPIKPLQPGEAREYRMKWDFSKLPLQEWARTRTSFQEDLWVQVETTKKVFRQHPIFSWYAITKTIPQVLPKKSRQ
jgi:hypothetical protein